MAGSGESRLECLKREPSNENSLCCGFLVGGGLALQHLIDRCESEYLGIFIKKSFRIVMGLYCCIRRLYRDY